MVITIEKHAYEIFLRRVLLENKSTPSNKHKPKHEKATNPTNREHNISKPIIGRIFNALVTTISNSTFQKKE